MRYGLISLLSVAIFAVACHALGTDNQNAATWYRKAGEQLDHLTWAELEVIWEFQKDVSAPPTDELRVVLAKIRPMVDYMRRGSRQEWADFGSSPIGPHIYDGRHLSLLQRVSIYARVDALVRLQDGDSAGAAGIVASAYRMSEHITSERNAGPTYQGLSIFTMADGIATVGFDQAVFNEEDARTMAKELKRLDCPDPFNAIEGMVRGSENTISWLRGDWDDPERKADLIGGTSLAFGPEAVSLANVSDEEFAEGLDQYDRVMDEVITAFEMPDREAGRAELERITKEIEDGNHGVLAGIAGFRYLHLFDWMEICKEKIDDRLTMLNGIIAGEIKPDENANAAVYYARGIEELMKIAPERFESVCVFQAESDQLLDEEMIKTLDEAAPIVDIFREGSGKKRCDFSFLRPRQEWRYFSPDYIAGMRDAIRLLHADAIRLLRSKDVDGAADRLAICYRIVGHMSVDDPILSALLAHRVFILSHELAVSALEAGELSEDHRTTLYKAADRIGRKDPFGYIGSINASQRALGWWAGVPFEDKYSEDPEGKRKIIKSFSGDQLIYFLAVFDALARAGREKNNESGEEEVAPIYRLDDVIRLTGYKKAIGEVNIVAPILARQELDIFRGRSIPCFGNVAERKRAARAYLRRSLSQLKPVQREPDASGTPEDSPAQSTSPE